MTEEVTPEIAEAAPEVGVADWAMSANLSAVEEILQSLVPAPWSTHPDPEVEGTFYISGPPDTKVVAEGLALEDAVRITSLINALPDVVGSFKDLARLWDALNDGALTSSGGEIDSYLEIIGKYQLQIAQLSGDPKPVPPAPTAGDISYRHVGHILRVADEYVGRIVSVTQSDTLTHIRIDTETMVLLPKDTKVEVEPTGAFAEAPTSPTAELSGEPAPSEPDISD